MIDTNIKGILNFLHFALPELKKNIGHVINVGSIASHHVFPNSGVYSATKHAVFAISESIRVELMGQVKVTTISPGAVNTNFINVTTNEELLASYKEYFESSMHASTIAKQIKHALEVEDNAVINEIIVRPFRGAMK
jgi:NADP-dependent 3-hydroxy acid dehydrogenase YdfG